MKILHFGQGSSIHVKRWVTWWAEHGHEIHLISDAPIDIKNVKVHVIPQKIRIDSRPWYIRYPTLQFNFLGPLKRVLKVRKLIKNIDPDIIHLYSIYFPAYLGVYAPSKYPLVIMPWNGDILWKENRSRFHSLFVKYALNKAKLILYNSEQMKLECQKLVSNNNKFHSRLGINTSLFYPYEKIEEIKQVKDIRDELELGNAPVILSTRSLGRFYNIDIIIKAIPTVLKSIPDAKFVFLWHAGSETQIETISKLVSTLKVVSSVRMVGKMNYKKLPVYYNLSDVFVSISSNDSAPMSLLEAMACGVPSVTADHPAVNEKVKDGYNGYVVPQRDPEAAVKAIVRLLTNEKIRTVFADRNLKWVRENADWDKNIRKVEDLYFKIVHARS